MSDTTVVRWTCRSRIVERIRRLSSRPAFSCGTISAMSYDLAVWEGDGPLAMRSPTRPSKPCMRSMSRPRNPSNPRLAPPPTSRPSSRAGQISPKRLAKRAHGRPVPLLGRLLVRSCTSQWGGAEPRKSAPSPLTLPRRMALCATTRKWSDSGPNSSAADTDCRVVGALPVGRGGRDGGNVDLRDRCP